jgi:hypothetical protein
MSFLSDEDFEELSVDGEVSAVTCSQYIPSKSFRKKDLKKLKIPILNKTTANPNTFEYEKLLKQVGVESKFKVDSDFVKTPSPRSDTRQTIERLLFNHQLSQNRKQFLRKEKELEEVKGCTFSPKIHSAERVLKKSNSQRQQNIKEIGKIDLLDKTSKSHSQEHTLNEQTMLSPKKDRVLVEGRPPIPKNKVNK